MRCEYCDVEVVIYPETGLCACCGAALPPRCAATPSTPTQKITFIPGITCCPKCRAMGISAKKRGFSWGIGVLGFLLIPVFGLLLGFIGSKKFYCQCSACGHRWIRPS